MSSRGSWLTPLRPPADEDIHDLIAERYEQASTIVTSNLDFAEWNEAFPNTDCWLPPPSIACDTTPTASSWKVRPVAIRKSPRRPRNQSLPTVRNLLILKPVGMSVRPAKTRSIMPIIPGSITPIGDKRAQAASQDGLPQSGLPNFAKGTRFAG